MDESSLERGLPRESINISRCGHETDESITCASIISVIIPTYNEEENIADSLRALDLGHNPNVELLIVDGGSTDRTVDIATSFKGVQIHKCIGPASRARCLNQGSGLAKGDILLFLHADTLLPPGYATQVRLALLDKETTLGAFSFAVSRTRYGHSGRRVRVMERSANLRARYFKLPYGDQALFIRREVFESLGRFPDMKMMEDYVFVRRAGGQGNICILDSPAICSIRRWEKLGVWRTTMLNQLFVLAYSCGVDPALIRDWYYSS
eukprot:987748_1